MSKYANAVKVRKVGRYVWRWDCPCGDLAGRYVELPRAHRGAARHAAGCEDLQEKVRGDLTR